MGWSPFRLALGVFTERVQDLHDGKKPAISLGLRFAKALLQKALSLLGSVRREQTG
jgi:hypothetical protein